MTHADAHQASSRGDQPIGVLYSFPHVLGRTGIGYTAWQQVSGLVRQGVPVWLAAGRIARPVPGVRATFETLRFGPLPLKHRVLGKWRACQVHDRRVAGWLGRLGSEVRVVHGWPGGSLTTFEAARRAGVASVVERPNAHTGFAFETVDRLHQELGLVAAPGHSHRPDPARLAREEAEYAAADGLLCPSPFVAETFRDRGYAEDQLLLHRYGYDDERFTPADEANGNDDRANDARPGLRVAFCGGCEPRKGLHDLLAAWAESSASDTGRLRIAGAFTPGYREKCAQHLGRPSVTEDGFVDDVPALMRWADVLALPSYEEGSALVTYEAMGAGTPLLVSTASGAFAEDGVHGLFHAPGDRAGLCSHLDRLASEPDLLPRLRAGVLEHRVNATWSAAAEALVDAYGTVLRRRGEATHSKTASEPSAPEVAPAWT